MAIKCELPLTEESHTFKRSLSFSTYLCFFSLIFPLLGAAGWVFEIPLLKQGHPALPAMRPNAILGLLLSVIAVFLSRQDWRSPIRSLIASFIATVVSLLGLLTLGEYTFGWELGVADIFNESTGMAYQPFPGRPSPQASLNFLLFGLAVIALNLRLVSIYVSQIGAILVGANALIAATGYIFSTSQFYGFPVYSPAIGMAINTSMTFILLTAALLFSRPTEGMMTLLTSDTQGGCIARKIFFTAVVIPPLVGLLTRIGVTAGWYNAEFQVSLFAVVIVGLILRTTWKASRQAQQEEIRARAAFDEANLANEQLKRALDERELSITERKRLEEDLRLAEAKSSGIISISPDAIISVDDNQRITLFNEGAQKIFGYSNEEAIGKSLDILIPERFRATHRQLVSRFANGEQVARRAGERGKSVFGLRKSGEEFPADAAISKLEVGGKRILTVALRDITEQKRIENELKSLAEKEQLAKKTREDVLAIVSHDLKNPLSSISLVAQLLQKLNPNDFHQVNEYATRVLRSVNQMKRLISDLLDFGKIHAGTFSVEKFREDPIEVILPIVEMVRIQAEAKRQNLEIDLDPALPLIDCDADRMGQVLSNLLGNAIKFTPEGGTIRLTATTDKNGILISVSDTGPGIPAEQLPRVFDRFWQAKEAKNLGSGLGLSIVKGIIEAHGARIWAESQIGKGSCFSFTIPLATTTSKVRSVGTLSSEPISEDGRRSLEGIHVMLVDDSPDALFLMKHVLHKAGARVTEAKSGTEALSKVSEERPNLIITDIEMPECDGYSLIKKIHRMSRDEHGYIPVAALTGHTDEDALRKISEAGFDVHLSKPVQADKLISSIRLLVDRDLLLSPSCS